MANTPVVGPKVSLTFCFQCTLKIDNNPRR